MSIDKYIPVAEYAKIHGKSVVTVRQMAARGSFKTAVKISKTWLIDKDEPYPDHRISSGKYIGSRKK